MEFQNITENFYRLFHPKIVGIIVTRCGKVTNFMTLAWHIPISEDELLFGIVISKENYTYELLKKTKEFTLNFLSIDYLKDIWTCGTISGRDMDKTKLVSFTLEDSNTPGFPIPHIKEALAYIEARVEREIEFTYESLFICRVINAFARKEFFRDMWSSRAKIVMHVGKTFFCTPSEYINIKKKK